MAQRSRGWLAGAVAAAVALGTAELLAGLVSGAPSLVATVGALFIPLVPPFLKDWAIDLFGTTDKAVLEATVIVATLGFGAAIGRVAQRDFRRGLAGLALLGLFGAVVVAIDPVAEPLAAIFAVVVATGVGAAALWGLVVRVGGAPRSDEAVRSGPAARDGDEATRSGEAASGDDDRARSGEPAGPQPTAATTDGGRRRFLVAAGGVAAAAVVTGWTGRALLRAPSATSRQAVTLPRARPAVAPPDPANRLAVDRLTPIVVPNDEFYRIDVNLTVPRVDAAGWRLRIHGMVDREVEFTYDELTALPIVEEYVTLSCVSNEVGGDLVGNAAWRGVPLDVLLERAGVQEGATQLVGRSVDGWTAGFPTELATDGRVAMVAVGMNGEPLPSDHGFPARLVVAGLYGYVSATKWLSELELTTWDGFDAYWVPRGWAKEGPIKTQSRIDVPRSGGVTAGEVVVAGVAWAPDRGIGGVELQVDDGPWQACEVTEPLSDAAWVQWRLAPELGPGDHVLRVRAVDADGEVQTAEEAPPRPDGATGHHTVRVTAA